MDFWDRKGFLEILRDFKDFLGTLMVLRNSKETLMVSKDFLTLFDFVKLCLNLFDFVLCLFLPVFRVSTYDQTYVIKVSARCQGK